jgi:uncharacterized protein YbjT (DUF2867 family)
MTVLVTGATGMFGAAVANALCMDGVDVLAMTRSQSSAEKLTRARITGVVGDLDDPKSLEGLLERADRMFLVSPMHPLLGERESAAIKAAADAGIKQIVKLYGSVRHEGDALDIQHQIAIETLKSSGVAWTLVSPQTVMETNLLGQIEGIKQERSMYGSAGNGRIGMVALCDCIAAASIVLQSNPEKWGSTNLEITGPAALTYMEIAVEMSRALNETITYVDVSEEEFASMLIEFGFPKEDLEIQVLCHFRQMRNGQADLVTDTFQKLTGKPATSVYDWMLKNRDLFDI